MAEHLRGHLAMLVFSLCIAGSFSLGSLVANRIDPVVLTAARFVLGAAIMGAAAAATGTFRRRAWVAPWRYLVLGGLFAVYFVLMFEGLKTARPVQAAAVFTLTPVMTAGFAYVLLAQILTRRMAVALAIGAAGATWVIFRADLRAILAFEIGRGEVTYFAGCVAHAVYTPMIRRLNRGEAPVVFTFGTLAAGAGLLCLYDWREIAATDWRGLPGIVWLTIGYLTVFATAASFWLVQYATLRLPSAKVMAYTYLVPSWVILWEIALGHGVPGALVLLGVAATFGALWLLLKDEDGARA
ncbi:MAG: DMT family transporter [Rhodobacteraceae bacterium]|uniref:DMT family transporter n=1 Tax=Albidovulum sp. TaxID=1872424 RepID=UPI001D470F7C|nr:DMT family transporter [Paracoccaceae bacterium]MCC0045204.1 DMT family transporter [Defluviimonas sp.]HPE25117.1 DMT family transporter [Albidovulum sp.]MCB2123177.1 DMT family transporter [Paracoccaceae bacterium]MCB2131059.1 DMT family transporter [Paracoccaceae bacterium]